MLPLKICPILVKKRFDWTQKCITAFPVSTSCSGWILIFQTFVLWSFFSLPLPLFLGQTEQSSATCRQIFTKYKKKMEQPNPVWGPHPKHVCKLGVYMLRKQYQRIQTPTWISIAIPEPLYWVACSRKRDNVLLLMRRWRSVYGKTLPVAGWETYLGCNASFFFFFSPAACVERIEYKTWGIWNIFNYFSKLFILLLTKASPKPTTELAPSTSDWTQHFWVPNPSLCLTFFFFLDKFSAISVTWNTSISRLPSLPLLLLSHLSSSQNYPSALCILTLNSAANLSASSD